MFRDSRVLQGDWIGVRLFPPGWEARLYGRQGCLPLRRPEETLVLRLQMLVEESQHHRAQVALLGLSVASDSATATEILGFTGYTRLGSWRKNSS